MNASILFSHILTGLAYGMLLFMIAAGLSIIMGFMNVVNLAHGSFFMIAAYVAFALMKQGMGFWVALMVTIILVGLFGWFMEKVFLARVYGKELDQVLLTFGLTFIFSDLVKWAWGTSPQSIPVPGELSQSIHLGETVFPVFRLFVIMVGVLVAVLLWYFESRTRVGSVIRAGVDDRQMVSALGINVGLAFSGVFAFGALLAGFSGVLGGAVTGIYLGMDAEVLISSLVVVVIGGLGTWKGAFAGAILVGMIDTLGKVWFPSVSMALVFILMVIVLLVRPTGLFGRGVQL
ncbi:branched-chain amino acid ABC transporter permease [Paenibacillus validus]|uniref:branched-chain amino acid ABC transporter permease n=1 Tax=Paenibacillus TaxID=44249 RepID=UPI001F20148D|nr:MULTISPECIES: branched-chain amino acid ABC transporter permease [Paenibacillus]MED4603273.1 branched-chain amino acid ABC transporter permease [Paenibacillus validus]MED4605274.1 branched-chain amino acid ABC transporter permease [Paenibacillus validus]